MWVDTPWAPAEPGMHWRSQWVKLGQNLLCYWVFCHNGTTQVDLKHLSVWASNSCLHTLSPNSSALSWTRYPILVDFSTARRFPSISSRPSCPLVHLLHSLDYLLGSLPLYLHLWGGGRSMAKDMIFWLEDSLAGIPVMPVLHLALHLESRPGDTIFSSISPLSITYDITWNHLHCCRTLKCADGTNVKKSPKIALTLYNHFEPFLYNFSFPSSSHAVRLHCTHGATWLWHHMNIECTKMFHNHLQINVLLQLDSFFLVRRHIETALAQRGTVKHSLVPNHPRPPV